MSESSGGGQTSSRIRDAVPRGVRTRTQHFWARVSRLANRHLPAAPPLPEPDGEQPPEQVLDFLRRLGVVMCAAGDAADRIAVILHDVATAFAADHVRFLVLPTGVLVRIGAGESSRVDFAPARNDPLRLDQVDALYRLIDEIRHGQVDVAAAHAHLDALLASKPRFGAAPTILGNAVLTLGLGLMLNPTASAVPAFLVLGCLVGLLRWWADHNRTLGVVLPVATAFVITIIAFQWSVSLLNAPPLEIVIPTLVTFLPGAALTMATVELAAGSMVSGASRLVYGLERLLLLSFGIATGVEVAGLPDSPAEAPHSLGAWAPWIGVLVFGIGQYYASSAPRRTFRWLLLVLYVAYAVQASSGLFVGPLGASFLAGAVVLPVAYAVQYRRSGPPVPVTFLPAFWLLVPGALGLQGVTMIVGANEAAGLGDFINALMTIVAIAVGVLVGTGLSETIGRATSTWRGL
jgi:uncharacterized membrane protein YjjP (DUF1212 family)